MAERSLGWAFMKWRLLCMALLVGVGAAELNSTCPDYVTRHAPLVLLHPDEPYMPSDILTHIKHTSPQLDHKALTDLPSLDLDSLEVLNQFGEDVALTSKDDPAAFPPWILGERPDEAGVTRNATPCVVILVEKSEVVLDAFYFYFYSFNEGPNITQVLEPLDSIIRGDGDFDQSLHFGNHVGDWEHNMIRFQDGEPVGIYYSQHRDGAAYDWDDERISKTDNRPITYSARGTHATYPTKGDQVHDFAIRDYCDEGPTWDPVLSAYFYHFDPPTFTLTHLSPPGTPSPPSSNLTSWFHYTGRWGDAQYPDSDPRQATVPNFGLKRFVTGPNGPRFKHLVRKGLMRDELRRLSWLEWAVGVYMAWYPCCLRGWRVWVSLGVVATAMSGIIIGVWIGVRKWRSRRKGRAYSRVESGEIPLEDFVMEEQGLLSSSDDEDDDGGK